MKDTYLTVTLSVVVSDLSVDLLLIVQQLLTAAVVLETFLNPQCLAVWQCVVPGSAVLMEDDPDLVIRDVQPSDYHKGYLKVLEHLTTVGDISLEQFEARLVQVRANTLHQMIVIEQLSTGTIVAAGNLFCLPKITQNCATVGHIEDVAVDPEIRRKKLGSRIIRELVRRGHEMGCYKIRVDCKKANMQFYEHNGFRHRNYHQMVIYVDKVREGVTASKL